MFRTTRNTTSRKNNERRARLGPPRGEDPGPAMKRINAKAAVVGERGKSAEVRCLAGLQVGVVGKAVSDFLGLGKTKLLGADGADPKRFNQRCDLAQLARIVRCDDEPFADRPHRPVAFSCA